VNNARTWPLLRLLVLAGAMLPVAGCGHGTGSGTAVPTSTSTATREPTETARPTRTPAPPLPETSVVTLEPAGPPAGDGYLPDGLYIADASTGDIFKVETAPGPILEPRAWISPTELVLLAWEQSDHGFYLLDLDTKTLRRLPTSGDDRAVSFSHSGGLMTSPTAAGELVISSLADNREVARIDTGPIRYVLWAPDDKHIYWPGAPAGIASVGPKPAVVAVDTGAAVANVSWFADGSAIAFANADGIFSINADTGEKNLLYSWPPGSGLEPHSLKLSPDGGYALVTAGYGPTDGFRALIVPLAGGTQGIQITGVDAYHAEWSPAEAVVAIIADWCKPEGRLQLLNPDGSIRATVESHGGQVPRFSPDGSMVAYVGSAPQAEGTQKRGGVVVVRAVEGNNVLAVIPGFRRDEWWSPDGHWLAYSPIPPGFQCVGGLEETEILPFP